MDTFQADFWAQLVDTAYWQIILLFLTAFTTSGLTQFFISRTRNKERLRICKSEFRHQSYLLRQLYLSRLQDELHCNVYEARLTGGLLSSSQKILTEEQLKINIERLAASALGINEVYGKIVANLAEIQLLVGDRAFAKIDSVSSSYITARSIAVSDLSLHASEEEINSYLQEESIRLQKQINKDVMVPAEAVYTELRNLKIAFRQL